jgi:hypothetical protein
MNAACEIVRLAHAGRGASPSETEDELLVPSSTTRRRWSSCVRARDHADRGVAARVAGRLEAVQMLATACCSAAFVDELDEAPEDDEHALPSVDEVFPDARLCFRRVGRLWGPGGGASGWFAAASAVGRLRSGRSGVRGCRVARGRRGELTVVSGEGSGRGGRAPAVLRGIRRLGLRGRG